MKALVLGATSTIAQELQKIWALRGSTLVLVARNHEELERIGKDLEVRGARVHLMAHDLLDYKNAESLVNEAWSKCEDISVVFMAHGILGDQRSDERSVGATIKIIDSNFNSHISYLTAVANKMEAQGFGKIAVITSAAGDRGKQSNYIYGAAKAGKIAFLAGLRNRLFAKGISVTDLRLGFVDTAMTVNFKKGPLWAKPEPVAQSIDKAILAGKDVVYIPKIWWMIMFIIRSIPEFIFKRLKL